jgi:hypothetical protein
MMKRMTNTVRAAATMVLAGGLVTASVVGSGVAPAAASSMVRVKCGTSYSHCVALRRAYVKDGARIGPLHIGHPGCTAVPEVGCATENWFYVYR